METLYRNLRISLAMMAVFGPLLTDASQANEVISAAEIQHFEQTYEDLAAKVIRSLQPKLEFTILARVELSAHPEKLAAYEETRATHHLPGLPEVTDPNYTHPFESPLLPLLEKKTIKIFFRSALSRDQDRVIREVIQAKLKLTASDHLVFESTGGPTSSVAEPRPSNRKIATIGLITGIVMLGFGLLGRKAKQQGSNLATDSTGAASATTLPATHQIANANAATLREALAQERVDVIAKASMNATRRFSHRILGEMDQEKFDLVNQWIERNKGLVANADSSYARLMLAARIQQLQNQTLMKSIEGFSRMRSLRKELQIPKKPSDLPTPNREVTA
jgi:hypothetical protein